MTQFKLACAMSCMLLTAHAWAHVTVSPKQAEQGSYQRLAFGITHGCQGSSTVEVTISLPGSIMGAKPMPKAGWTVETDVGDLAEPYMSHGKEVRRDVRSIRWRGKLLDAHYDEFIISAKVGGRPGPVAIPVSQVCDEGRMDWSEVRDRPGVRLDFPAPTLEVSPGEHRH